MTRKPGDLPQESRIRQGCRWGGREINMIATTKAAFGSDTSVRALAIVLFLFGATLVYLTGFAHSTTLHNAAHDTRHAFAFPCH